MRPGTPRASPSAGRCSSATPCRAGSKDVAQTAFQAGYRAGENDAFGAYDGGWKLGAPYVVILGKGVGGAAYRFVERDELTPGTTYRLCPDGTSLCHS